MKRIEYLEQIRDAAEKVYQGRIDLFDNPIVYQTKIFVLGHALTSLLEAEINCATCGCQKGWHLAGPCERFVSDAKCTCQQFVAIVEPRA